MMIVLGIGTRAEGRGAGWLGRATADGVVYAGVPER